MIDFTDKTVVATDTLRSGTARAANAGDILPRATIDAHPEWADLVAEHGTQEAIDALGYDPYSADEQVSETDPPSGFDAASANVVEVLEHVQRYPESAESILAAEKERPNPRTTLIAKLGELMKQQGEMDAQQAQLDEPQVARS